MVSLFLCVKVGVYTEGRNVFASIFNVKDSELIFYGISHFTRPVKAITFEFADCDVVRSSHIRKEQLQVCSGNSFHCFGIACICSFRNFDCYLFGNEARGLPRESPAALAAENYAIRGCGAIESLNLASVVGICLYELNR